ncbi:DUF202 domain-containing protein [Nocardioides sp. TRM66260-LWL]|uniref:YidH family protein n=1 Tax=Nocardioides sp. TRM66260-LWL TaxID=2874478 RepID=UPI001CC79212|nr:DUF202 domain-containing protein [Nocardioides sp. TRM66260-LWL]MBZ5735099.1 DUF202 domain-containing protein [Nocardioides sp. TRM66260-LWL]
MSERRPPWVYDAGEEPDPRFSLANERTFLAWVRTSLALIAGAVALHSLGVPDVPWARATLVVLLVGLGAGMTVLAYLRWARVERAMRLREPLPAFSVGLWMTIAIVVIAVLLAVVLLLG